MSPRLYICVIGSSQRRRNTSLIGTGMNGRERVECPLAHQEPDRIPIRDPFRDCPKPPGEERHEPMS